MPSQSYWRYHDEFTASWEEEKCLFDLSWSIGMVLKFSRPSFRLSRSSVFCFFQSCVTYHCAHILVGDIISTLHIKVSDFAIYDVF